LLWLRGYSREAEISYKSAVTVANNVDKDLFDVYKIDISREGWFFTDNEGNKTAIAKNDFSLNFSDKKITFDAALMCIHGNPGEDGTSLFVLAVARVGRSTIDQ